MPQKFSSKFPLPELSAQDRRRLECFASYFDLRVEHLSEELTRIHLGYPTAGQFVDLPPHRAAWRLATEVASKSARWHYFHAGESCLKTLMDMPDAKVARIAELYKEWLHNGAYA